MDLTGIREALHREPFARFSFRLADGRIVPVNHPDFVAMNERRIIVIDERGGWKVIERLLIVSLDYDAPGRPRS